MSSNRNRKIENTIYVCLWLLIAWFYVLDYVRDLGEAAFGIKLVWRTFTTLFPLMVLFLINNLVLIPRLLLRNRIWLYFLMAAICIAAFWTYQYLTFVPNEMFERVAQHGAPHGGGHLPPRPRPVLPMPLYLDFIYAILVIGVNLAVALMFQRFEDRLGREMLMKANAENELAYLKAQINPHFYMNMLNNIHGMIEINAEKAQTMVIEMSHLMRYMLYESSRPRISLEKEIEFLGNYIRLMRQRYPENRVAIDFKYPMPYEIEGVNLPPLLFLVFVENAFKHGISYREKSFVDVEIKKENNRLVFKCLNSRFALAESAESSSGIGLRNIRQRLMLIYAGQAELEISEEPSKYSVTLEIPAYETTDNHNR